MDSVRFRLSKMKIFIFSRHEKTLASFMLQGFVVVATGLEPFKFA